GQESAQHRPTEEFPSRSDLRRDRVLAQPALVLPGTVRVVESTLECQRDMFGEEDFWSRAKRHPLIPVMLRISVLAALVNKDWHDGKPVVRLKNYLLCNYKLFRAIKVWSRIINIRTEVAGRSGPVLDGKRVIAAVPLQPLMAQSKCVAIRGGYCASWCVAALRSCVVEPAAPEAGGSLQVIETHVNVALREGAVGGYNVGTRPGKKCHRHLANPEIDVLNACAITAHVQRIEVVDVNVLPAVVSFAS